MCQADAGGGEAVKELLERFCELAPKEWNPRSLLDSPHSLVWIDALDPIEDESDAVPFLLDSDRASAEAIIFLWDYLDSLLEIPVRWGEPPAMNDGSMVYSLEVTRLVDVFIEDAVGYVARTRIEALVRACVAYWESQEVKP